MEKAEVQDLQVSSLIIGCKAFKSKIYIMPIAGGSQNTSHAKKFEKMISLLSLMRVKNNTFSYPKGNLSIVIFFY